MFTTPARLLKTVNKTRELESGVYGLLALHRDLALLYLQNRDLEPTSAHYDAAAGILTKWTGLYFSTAVTQNILSLFPFVRIKLAEKGISGSGLSYDLADVAGYFILGCRWPVYRDKVDMNTFLEVLRNQGEKMGLTRVRQNQTDMSPEERRASFAVIPGGTDA